MRRLDKVCPVLKGVVEYGYVEDGRPFVPVLRQDNILTLQGADALALAMSTDAKVNAMYFVYENDEGASKITTDRENDATTYATAAANRNVCRTALVGCPVFSTSSSSEYDSNKVSLLAVTDGTSMLSGVPFTDGVSRIYHSALVLARDLSDRSLDLVVNCVTWDAPLVKVAGAQIGLRWTVKFTTP